MGTSKIWTASVLKMNTSESIKDWIKTSKTYTGILAHRQTCDKKHRGKLCIKCTGGEVDDIVDALFHEIQNQIGEGNSGQKTTVLFELMRFKADMALPRCFRTGRYEGLYDFIKDLTQKELECEGES